MISSFESFGKGEERNRGVTSSCSPRRREAICNRMDETFDGGFELKSPKRGSNSWVPLRSSWRILFGTMGSVMRSRMEVSSRHFRKTRRGASFERALNRGHALTAPGIRPNPKPREPDCHFVPKPTDFEEVERSRSETRFAIFKAGLDEV